MSERLDVLWLGNVVLPGAARALGLPVQVGGGWMEGQIEALAPQLAAGRLRLWVVCPSPKLDAVKRGQPAGGVEYIAVPGGRGREAAAFRQLLDELKPDLVHIFGTEYAHNAAMLAAAGPARHYSEGLPNRFRRRNPLKMAMKYLYAAGVVADEQRSFEKAGRREAAMLRSARYVAGRTGWDRACVWRLNPDAEYRRCGEILRPAFYGGPQWRYENCEKQTIFLSQGYYPVKGTHVLLEQLPAILERWPRARLLIGGQKPYSLGPATRPLGAAVQSLVDFFFEYQGYLRRLCRRLGVERHVEWLGPLDAAAMRAAYLRANVFVNPSSIENSPNSLAEAMALGVPVVASAVGGVPDMLENGTEGLLYPAREGYLLPYLVNEVFAGPQAAAERGLAASRRALGEHDPLEITKTLLSIYEEIAGRAGGAAGAGGGG